VSASFVTPTVVARPVWGTVVRIEVRDAFDPRALDDVWSWFDRVDERFSTWRPDSEVARLARGELAPADAHPDLGFVLDQCEQLRRASGGAFDAAFASDEPPSASTGRSPIDPTGFVKGWAIDRAAAMIRARGASHLAINAGGDIVVRSPSPTAPPWRIGIQDPARRGGVVLTLALAEGAVATSGAYERGDHVIDARTGRPARGLTSVSVVARDLATADGHATAAIALGHEGVAWLETRPDVEAFGITDAGARVWTSGFEHFVTG
jgi:thiamine biosynthesis lipoprotein